MRLHYSLMLLALLLFCASRALAGGFTYGWSETAGWLDYAPTNGGATVYADHLEGYAWQENIGWVSLGSFGGGVSHTYDNTSAADWGINRNGDLLSGYAWSETGGWIDFNPPGGGVTYDAGSGRMNGWAWGENIGWVRFYPLTLSIAFAGTGGNKVDSTDHYINCLKGSSDGCSAGYAAGTAVTLQATADWKSTFIGWSGDYASSANPGTVTMDTNKTVTATFDPNNKAKLIPGDVLFASIQDAYAGVPSGSMTIQAQAWSFLEDLLFANATAVTLTGGMDSSYNPTSGYATVKSLTVETGSVVIGNIMIH